MHLPDQQLFDAVYGLRRVLRPGGRLLLSIPARRTDVDPETRRDAHGRYVADLPPTRLRLLLERVGFRLLWRRESDDAQGRPDTQWTTFLFEWPGAIAERLLDQVESILNRDKKDATYKLALLRALAEIAQTQYHATVFDRPGKVGIPIRVLADKWLHGGPLARTDPDRQLDPRRDGTAVGRTDRTPVQGHGPGQPHRREAAGHH